MEEDFNLILSTIVNEKLCVDPESDFYSFIVYDRSAISDATRIVIKSLAEDEEKVKKYISSQRRIDTLMEFIGVALSLSKEDHSVISKAFSHYKNWLINSGHFGDMKNQNLYIRRIIKQLSMPFALMINKETYDINLDILNSLDRLTTERTKDLDIDTWKILLFVTIGICQHLIMEKDSNNSSEMYSSLKRSAVNLCFDVLKRSPFTFDYYNSKLGSKNIWMVFMKYTNLWSGDLVFMKVWNERINSAFKLLYSRLYKFDCGGESDKFDSALSDKVVQMLFFYTLKSVNCQLTLNHPELLEELYTSLENLINQILDYSESKSNCLKVKFPAKSFFELFGKILTFTPVLDKRFDKAISIRLQLIVKIIACFDTSGVEDLILKLIATIGWNINDSHIEFVTSFILNAIPLFEAESKRLPYISSLIAQSIPKIKITSSSSDKLLSSIISCFVSAMEVGYLKSTYESIFNSLWKSTEVIQNKSIRYALICHSAVFKIPVFERIIDYFEPPLLKTLINSSNAYLIAGFMGLISSSIRFEFEFMKEAQNIKIVKQILKSLTEAEIQGSPNFNLIVLSALQMVYTLIEYDSEMFNDEENIGLFFKFFLFVQKNTLEKKRKGASSTQRNHKASGHNIQPPSGLPKKEETTTLVRKKSQSSITTPASNDEKNSTKRTSSSDMFKLNEGASITTQIHNLLSMIFIRLNLHLPSNDYFTHHFNTSKYIDEQSVIKQLGIKDYVINYYTIGRSLLVSFIESKDGDSVIFSRGPFGKSIWRLTQKFRENGQDPKLSDEILPQDLPEPKNVEKSIISLHGEKVKLIDSISDSELSSIQNKYLEIHSKEYCKWIDWNNYSKFFIPWQYKGEKQRALINDFLNGMGLFEIGNKLDVRIQSDMKEVNNSIAEFEKFENPVLFPIEIVHVMPEDKDLEYNSNHFNRMTPLMLKFLNEIGESFSISKNDSQLIKWPNLKSPIPVFPCLDGYGAFILPSLCDDQEAIKKIEDLKAPIRIFFNNTDFQLNDKHIQKSIEKSNALLVLIVKPRIDGVYYVQQVKGEFSKVSPFSYGQVLSAKTLSFYLSLSLELMNYDGYTSNAIKDRRNAFNNLCKSSARTDISMISPEEFKI